MNKSRGKLNQIRTLATNQKVDMEVEKDEAVSDAKGKSMDVVCFNCGEIGHYSTACGKARCCFICRLENHVVDDCPEWKKNYAAAQFCGSACKGLGFFHIDVEPRGNRFNHWKGLDNFGILTIEQGDISEADLIGRLKRLFDEKWDWKLRPDEEYTYIVRFPPHKRVENLVIGKMSLFPLEGSDAVASIKPWNGDVEPISSLEEVWIQVKGIPPKWADWWTIRDVASSLGLLLEVDWTELFASYFSTVRMRIKCKNPAKVPFERVYELGGDCYIIYFKTEGVEQIGNPKGRDDGGSDGKEGDKDTGDKEGEKKNEDNGEDDDLDEEDLLDDDTRGLEESKKDGGMSRRTRNKQDGQADNKKGHQRSVGNVSLSQKNTHSVRRSLNFLEDKTGCDDEQTKCTSLLRAMELDSSDDEEDGIQQDLLSNQREDEEMLTLPKEWVDHLVSKRSEGNLEGMIVDSQEIESGAEELISKEDEEQQCTQPSVEEVARCLNQNVAEERPKKNKNQVWGPILAPRKSKRLCEDGKSMLQKAQENKKKQNLDGCQGKKSKTLCQFDSSTLSDIANVIGVVAKDGHPFNQNLLDSMIDLDQQRGVNHEKLCK